MTNPYFQPAFGRLSFVHFIFHSWTGLVAVWLAVAIVAAIVNQSGIPRGSRVVIGVIAPIGSFAMAWAIFADRGQLVLFRPTPPLDVPFFALWGAALLGILPVLFVLLGGLHTHAYHPRWAPFEMTTKAVSLAASIVSIVGFYLQNRG